MNRAAITDTASAKAQRLESVATRVPRQYGHHGVYDDWRDRGLGSLGSGGLLGLPNDLLGRIEGYVDPRPKGPRPPDVKTLAVLGRPYNWNHEIPPRDRVLPNLSTFLDQVRNSSGDDQWLERANVMFERQTAGNTLASGNTFAAHFHNSQSMYEEGRRNLQVI